MNWRMKVDSGAEILLPLAYPFPNLGTFTILMFIPFSAWYLGTNLEPSEQLVFLGSAFLSSFVAPISASFLFILQIPADMMGLSCPPCTPTESPLCWARFTCSLAVVSIAISRGAFKLNVSRLAAVLVLSAVILLGTLFSVRTYPPAR